MIYLASPYSNPDPLIVRNRFLLVEQATAELIKQKLFVWSPIVHCHELATKFGLPTDAAFWAEYNFDFIRRSDAVFVLKIPGWDESKGVKMEISLANAAFIPLQFVNENGELIS